LKYSPFSIISLEKKFSGPFEVKTDGGIKTVELKGFIDRIDSKDGIIRIIDYKTGSTYFKELKDNESYFDEIAGNVKYKDSFQTLFYAFNHINNPGQKYKPVIYYVNENDNMVKEVKKTPLTQDDIDNFRSRLNNIFTDIFNPGSPFTQTENPDDCLYCPFSDLCYRR
jgi:CRISPR/Cas system-associated exonuclease Cas4 (RecB family)